jgi:hypothetical protein
LTHLKGWIKNRLDWIDENMPGRAISTGIPEFNNETDFLVYPNPVADYLVIKKLYGPEDQFTIDIFSITGKKLFSTELDKQQNSFSVCNLSEGYYLYQIRKEGIVLKTGKLIKH